jgi:hypothetical protein
MILRDQAAWIALTFVSSLLINLALNALLGYPAVGAVIGAFVGTNVAYLVTHFNHARMNTE